MAKLLASLLCLLVLTGCGYSLRGSGVLGSEVESLTLNAQQPNSQFARLLRRSLTVADIAVREGSTTEDGQLTLMVGNEQVASRPVSVNPRARAAQYEIRVSVSIALRRGDEMLLSPETLIVERSYFEDIENIAGTQEEVDILTEEMRRELVNQVMRRLEAAAARS